MSRTATILAAPLLAGVALAVVFPTGSWAAEPAAPRMPGPAPPSLAETFGNTVLSVYPDGRSQKVWIQPDGTWTGLSRRGVQLAGHWTQKGDKVCLRQSKPPTLPISFCQALPADMTKGVESRDVLGTPIHLRLVKGVAEAPG